MSHKVAVLAAALAVWGCTAAEPAAESKEQETTEHPADGVIALTPAQIAAGGIKVGRPSRGGADAAIEAAALLESDPDSTRIVAASVSGRVVELRRNLGDAVSRGQVLAVIESREAASLNAEVERARARSTLAQATLRRDETLHARGYRPLREVEVSRAAATEAEVAVRLARQQVAASGVQGGSLSRIVIASPIAGHVIARTAVLGQTFSEDAEGAELFRIADLSRLNAILSLPPAEAARVRPGTLVDVAAAERRSVARVTFVSPVLDPATRLVRVIASLDNSAGRWRAGEPVQGRVRIPRAATAAGALMVPAAAVQTIDSRPTLFVRTPAGFRATPVTLGSRDGPMIAVLSGLTGNETLAVEGSFVLKSELGKGAAGHEGH